jgi:polyphosphate kinase
MASVPSELPPDRFINRELAWLAFNERVLREAMDASVPLLERLKFLAIFSRNMDEFFMVRVAGLKRLLDAGVTAPFPDGSTPAQIVDAVAARCRDLAAMQNAVFRDEIRPQLEAAGVRLLAFDRLSPDQRAHVAEYFQRTVLPVVTPLAVDPGHPFPHLANRTICLVVRLRPLDGGRGDVTAVVPVPTGVLPRLVRVPGRPEHRDFVLLEELVRGHLASIFQGHEVVFCSSVRVTRDWDLVIDEENADDLLRTIEERLRLRRSGKAVRLHHDSTLAPETRALLVRELELEDADVFEGRGLVGFADFMQLWQEVELPALRDPPLPPWRVPALDGSVFDAIRAGDVLVHHPYQTFDHVLRFVREAADDPAVLALKMTLYRSGGGPSPIVEALCRAARNGKQVAVLMELKARFDEQANIEAARRLQEAGAHVMYGLVGLKTHAKACLVVRREPLGIRRYAHVATGNYEARTASLYTDYGLFTADEGLCDDMTHVFNVITGYSTPRTLRHVALAPFGLRERLVALIRREGDHARAGRPARIAAQMNALVDPQIIDELYLAGRAGVRVELVVRGMCCLRPGVPGLSENVRVVRIVDRFLEHARVLHLRNGGDDEVYLASSDWMPRNLDRRVELMVPVRAPALRERVAQNLALQLADDVKGHDLDATARDLPRPAGARRSQLELHARSGPQVTQA